jgi:hypothetical protein
MVVKLIRTVCTAVISLFLLVTACTGPLPGDQDRNPNPPLLDKDIPANLAQASFALG